MIQNFAPESEWNNMGHNGINGETMLKQILKVYKNFISLRISLSTGI
jgi:hypothetical protein